MIFDKEYLYFRYYIEENLIGEKSREVYRLNKNGSEEPQMIADLPEVIQTSQ